MEDVALRDLVRQRIDIERALFSARRTGDIDLANQLNSQLSTIDLQISSANKAEQLGARVANIPSAIGSLPGLAKDYFTDNLPTVKRGVDRLGNAITEGTANLPFDPQGALDRHAQRIEAVPRTQYTPEIIEPVADVGGFVRGFNGTENIPPPPPVNPGDAVSTSLVDDPNAVYPAQAQPTQPYAGEFDGLGYTGPQVAADQFAYGDRLPAGIEQRELQRQADVAEQQQILDLYQSFNNNLDRRGAERAELAQRAFDREQGIRQDNINQQATNARLDQESAQFQIAQQRQSNENALAVAQQSYEDSVEAFARNKAINAAQIAMRALPEGTNNTAALRALSSNVQNPAPDQGTVANNLINLSESNFGGISDRERASISFAFAENANRQQDTDVADLRLSQLQSEVDNPSINPSTQFRADNYQFDPTAAQELIDIKQQEFKFNEQANELNNRYKDAEILSQLFASEGINIPAETIALDPEAAVQFTISGKKAALEKKLGKQAAEEDKASQEFFKSTSLNSATIKQLTDILRGSYNEKARGLYK